LTPLRLIRGGSHRIHGQNPSPVPGRVRSDRGAQQISLTADPRHPDANGLHFNPDDSVHAFVCDGGVAVLFRHDQETEKRLIDLLRIYAVSPLDVMAEEGVEYRRGNEEGIRNDSLKVDALAQSRSLGIAPRAAGPLPCTNKMFMALNRKARSTIAPGGSP